MPQLKHKLKRIRNKTPKPITTVRLPANLKEDAKAAGINISRLAEEAIRKRLEYLNHSEESYELAVMICEKFNMKNYEFLAQEMAFYIDKGQCN